MYRIIPSSRNVSSGKKRCNSSGKDDRFSRRRRYKSVKNNQMQEPTNIEISSSEDEYTFHIYIFKESNIKQQNTKVKICDTEVKMLVDTGTTINSLDESNYSKLRNCPAVNPTIIKVFPYLAEKPFNFVGSIYTKFLSLRRQKFTLLGATMGPCSVTKLILDF